MSLRDKRCKNTNETAMMVLELDRRKRIIAMTGGKPPDEDVTINILWMSMDPSTKAHVIGKIDMDAVGFVEMRQIVQSYTNLINSTTNNRKGGGAVAMDISSIASVGGSVLPDGAERGEDALKQQSHEPWSYDESGCPIYQ